MPRGAPESYMLPQLTFCNAGAWFVIMVKCFVNFIQYVCEVETTASSSLTPIGQVWHPIVLGWPGNGRSALINFPLLSQHGEHPAGVSAGQHPTASRVHHLHMLVHAAYVRSSFAAATDPGSLSGKHDMHNVWCLYMGGRVKPRRISGSAKDHCLFQRAILPDPACHVFGSGCLDRRMYSAIRLDSIRENTPDSDHSSARLWSLDCDILRDPWRFRDKCHQWHVWKAHLESNHGIAIRAGPRLRCCVPSWMLFRWHGLLHQSDCYQSCSELCFVRHGLSCSRSTLD